MALKIKMGRGVKFWLKIISAAVGSVLFLVIIFVIITLTQAPLDRLEQIKGSEQQVIGGLVELQPGSLVDLRDFKNFYLFAGTKKPYQEYLENLIAEGKIKKTDKYLALIVENIQLENLYENNCKHVYCYQHRIPFSEIPSVFWKGLIGIEDTRFLNHSGIDYIALARALVVDLIKMKFVQGGSTLTQQLVKNLFLSNEKTLVRKIKELIISIYIENKYAKENILEAYFNEVFWGVVQGVRVKGVFSAANFYFGKKINEITPYEAVILTAMLKGPGFYNPINKLDRLKTRVEVVFKKLLEQNKVSLKYSGVWEEKDWVSWQKKLIQENSERKTRPLWHLSNEKEGYINSYEKYVISIKSQEVLANISKRFGKYDIAVKMMLGNPNKKENTFSYYSKLERNKEKALRDERHQVGSTLKPVVYSIFNDLGKSFVDMVQTGELTLSLKSGKWTPGEAHKIAEKEVTLIEALEKSYNRPVIYLAQEVGFEKLEEKLDKIVPDLKKPLAEYPAQLLGAIELSIEELYNVYQKFIAKECHKTEDSNLLFLLSDPNRTTVRKIVGSKLKNLQFFGKTGTSNNGLDNWFVFYEGSQLGVIWVGVDGPRSGLDLQLYGGSTSFRIFQDYMVERGRRFGELRCD